MRTGIRRWAYRCAGEGGAQPFVVRGVAAVHQEAQAHQVAGEVGGDRRRAEFVAHLAAAAYEGLLLGDVVPLAGQGVEPDVSGVPAEGVAQGAQFVQAVVEDRSSCDLGQKLGGGRQPVRCGDFVGWVEAQRRLEPCRGVGYFDSVVDRAGRGAHDSDVAVRRRGEVRRVAVEGFREVLGQVVSDAARVAGDVPGAEEQLETRAPFVVRRARGVVAEDLGAAADAGGGVRDVGGGVLKEGADGFCVETAGEFEAR